MRKLFLLLITFRIRYPRESWRFWMKEVYRRELNDYWCCSCIDGFGQMPCGCYAVTVWEHYVWISLPRWAAVRLAPHVWQGK